MIWTAYGRSLPDIPAIVRTEQPHDRRPAAYEYNRYHIERVLSKLNKKVHKSVNQFIVDAVDFYINSMNDENLVEDAVEQKKDAGYITRVEFQHPHIFHLL